MTLSNLRKIFKVLGICLVLAYATAAGLTGSPALDASLAQAQSSGAVPGNSMGNISDAELWRAIRKGVAGTVSLPDKKAATLVQSEGDVLRAFRNGPQAKYGVWLLIAAIVVLAIFFMIRGRIKIGAGPSNLTIERFNALERFTHWLTASSFIVLALTGLNVMYGKYFLPALIGKSGFATITYWGKLAHNYIAFAFMLGIVMMFVLWVKDNFPNKYDLGWIATGGGMFGGSRHADTERFNFGQKVIFWTVVLGGGSLSFSGLCLMFPFEIAPFGPTFGVLKSFGVNVPTDVTALQETQLSLAWHGSMGVLMIAIIIGHIYIGSLGMEGAIDAVGSGRVDLNWAREHHNVWAARVEAEGAASPSGAEQQPAE